MEVPVCYDPVFALDLDEVSSLTKVTKQDVQKLHSTSKHSVLMVGFSPGQPYIGGLDPKLSVPRRATPRTAVSLFALRCRAPIRSAASSSARACPSGQMRIDCRPPRRRRWFAACRPVKRHDEVVTCPGGGHVEKAYPFVERHLLVDGDPPLGRAREPFLGRDVEDEGDVGHGVADG